MSQAVFLIDPSVMARVALNLVAAFIVAIAWTPLLTNFLYRNRVGKRLRQHGIDGKETPIFSKLHADKAGTPVMGGLLFWVTTAVFTLAFNLDRGETYLPLAALLIGGIVGGVDDIMNVLGKGTNGGGLRFLHKMSILSAFAAVSAWWFTAKLGFSTLWVPMVGNLDLGWFYPVLFAGVVLFVGFSLNQTDGLDGLAGGISLFAFGAYTFIAIVRDQPNLAVFCGTIAGSLLAFLWFNIHPARFFMGDTGSMALGFTLAMVAFLTDTAVLLPLILFIPFLEGISTIIQITSKKLFKRKVFRVAPIHHHFEAVGWPEARVTMRFWILQAIGASAGLALALVR